MISTIILAFLFLLVIAGGVLTLINGLKKLVFVGEAPDDVKKILNTDKYVGASLIGVGVIGLAVTVFNANTGGGASSGFGFKFY